MKKNNKILLRHLLYERCQIKLDDIEVNYLNSIFESNLKKSKSVKDVFKNTLEEFYKNSQVRYFKRHHIDKISSNLCESFKKKQHEQVTPARNIRSVFKAGFGNVTNATRIENSDTKISDIDVSIDAFSGDNIVYYVKNNKRHYKRFSSPEEAQLFVQQINIF